MHQQPGCATRSEAASAAKGSTTRRARAAAAAKTAASALELPDDHRLALALSLPGTSTGRSLCRHVGRRAIGLRPFRSRGLRAVPVGVARRAKDHRARSAHFHGRYLCAQSAAADGGSPAVPTRHYSNVLQGEPQPTTHRRAECALRSRGDAPVASVFPRGPIISRHRAVVDWRESKVKVGSQLLLLLVRGGLLRPLRHGLLERELATKGV